MKKIITILGARPQFVKGAVLSRVIQKHNEVEEIIVHTGQHFDANMSAVFFEEMQIPNPKYNLNINGLSHGAMTGQMLEKIEEILVLEKPDAVVVYGDTNSTLAGALAAKKLHIKVVHIEAGLRSFNMQMPEEINRILTDRIGNLLSCPTDTAVSNLRNEGFDSFDILIEKHGDIMKDAVEFYNQVSEEKSTIIKDLGLEKKEFVLATIHRQENTDEKERLANIFEALEKINVSKKVVLPLHPRTKKMLEKYKLKSNITFIEPVGYFSMLELLKNCALVITDSGGLQKEAFFNKKFCVIAREETEWKELVSNGYAAITGANSGKIINYFQQFLATSKDFKEPLYGDNVGEKIYQSILKLIKE
ncbi:non-hydrolyzing UDP-N-acetylglucosamine 2-epimerase [Tenacibaculum mesophilum]|uniref:UDP-N-acetylglucosamine 2-epimerase (Non-hydrolyzing) n=1 Tax=Tenacibaculum mesophilum TaxID=104268 RepID=A0AAE9SEB8_9FLAO|nr:UDP-N-acetylglucosamine 2-epimerase (non-hydrolyzing) [Tenacibaculum mesophilum]UTD14715.1 UDP-N-acetylglucosamine 2-epimerase (non-hydrolyzing) [Tenacibaculum mesophilum]BFF40596.1 UDP-N-acetylglucosamine 2-epimerase (non-hydrolyzing) [Tenacibaculum mesophilum]GFD92696.1 UDP-2,3-diacetamido-2,3-dideoxy-D-glucuronate 2-epimerase [Alteromonas sp. KUL154]GFD99892.1 UDP-2,3-diacetamido-2,3-dideoxy-D-glucuronate 2-epimerase [Alteromonas sp. KUL156]